MEKSELICLIAVIVVLTTVNAQMPGLGPCPDIAGVKDINVWKLVGVWYQIERYLSIVEAFTSCTTATYGSNTTVTGGSTNFPLTYQQKAAQVDFLVRGNVDMDKNGTFKTDFDFKLGVPKDFLYLEIDYDNYAVAYHCDDYFGVYHTQTLWVYARSKTPSSLIMDKAHQAIDKQKLSKLLLVKSEQENCSAPKCV